jgi:hypothetical protein
MSEEQLDVSGALPPSHSSSPPSSSLSSINSSILSCEARLVGLTLEEEALTGAETSEEIDRIRGAIDFNQGRLQRLLSTRRLLLSSREQPMSVCPISSYRIEQGVSSSNSAAMPTPLRAASPSSQSRASVGGVSSMQNEVGNAVEAGASASAMTSSFFATNPVAVPAPSRAASPSFLRSAAVADQPAWSATSTLPAASISVSVPSALSLPSSSSAPSSSGATAMPACPPATLSPPYSSLPMEGSAAPTAPSSVLAPYMAPAQTANTSHYAGVQAISPACHPTTTVASTSPSLPFPHFSVPSPFPTGTAVTAAFPFTPAPYPASVASNVPSTHMLGGQTAPLVYTPGVSPFPQPSPYYPFSSSPSYIPSPVLPSLHDLAVAAHLQGHGGKVARLPGKLPEYDPHTATKSALDYIIDVERILLSSLYPPERWSAALSSLVRGAAAAWAPTCHLSNGLPKPWAEVRASFLLAFSRSDVLQQQRRELHNIRQGSGESARLYALRHAKLRADVFETSESEQVLSDFQHSLDPQLRPSYALQVLSRPVRSLQEAYALAACVDDTLDRRGASTVMPAPRGGANKCHHCGALGHVYTQCHALKRVMDQQRSHRSNDKPGSTPSRQSRPTTPSVPNSSGKLASGGQSATTPPVVCSHCQKPGHTTERCYARDPSLRKVPQAGKPTKKSV